MSCIIRQYLVSFFITLTFVGCGRCEYETFNKSVLVNIPSEIKVSTDGPFVSYIRVNEDVNVIIGNCKNWSNSLCMLIMPSLHTRVSLESTDFIEYEEKSDIKTKIDGVNLIKYLVQCYTNKYGKRFCNSSEDVPTETSVTVKEYQFDHRDGSLSQHYLILT